MKYNSRYGNSGFYSVPLRTRFGRVLHFLTFIFIYIYLISICIYLIIPPLSQSLLLSMPAISQMLLCGPMHLNGRSVASRFDENKYHCQVTPDVILSPDGSLPDRAIVQVNYQGTSFTAEVPIVVCDINREFMLNNLCSAY